MQFQAFIIYSQAIPWKVHLALWSSQCELAAESSAAVNGGILWSIWIQMDHKNLDKEIGSEIDRFWIAKSWFSIQNPLETLNLGLNII